jgi:hypothetical protein
MMSTVGPGGEQPFSGLEDSSVDATVLRMLLGSQLRRFREVAGITPEQAGYEIRASRSKISRLENGRVKLKNRDVTDLAVDELSSVALTQAETARFIEQVARET